MEPCFSIRADFGTFLLTAEKIDRDLAALGGQFLFGFNVEFPTPGANFFPNIPVQPGGGVGKN